MGFGWTHIGTYKFIRNQIVQINVDYYEPVVNNKTGQMDYVKAHFEYLVSDYDDSGIDLFDFDIAPCTDKMRKRHFKFNLDSNLLIHVFYEPSILILLFLKLNSYLLWYIGFKQVSFEAHPFGRDWSYDQYVSIENFTITRNYFLHKHF